MTLCELVVLVLFVYCFFLKSMDMLNSVYILQSSKGEKTNVDAEGMQELPDELGMCIGNNTLTLQHIKLIQFCIRLHIVAACLIQLLFIFTSVTSESQ